jgi:hypothetical protein
MVVELRKHPRVATSLETIYFRDQNGEGNAERMHYFGTITNMSKGGVGLLANYPHERDEQLWLEGIGDSTIPLPGVVRWIKSNHEKFDIGIQFLEEHD